MNDMLTDLLLILKQELLITTVIFVLLILKVSSEVKNETLLNVINVILFVNCLSGFFFIHTGNLFSEMYRTNPLMVLEKNMLSIGTFIISLQSWSWLKKHQHVTEFYIILLSTLLGMFFLISAGNLLMFYLGLELSTIPLAAIANF